MKRKAHQLADRFILRTEVELLTAQSRATIYRKISNGTFPAPVALGTGAVRWKLSDVQAWMDSLTRTTGGN